MTALRFLPLVLLAQLALLGTALACPDCETARVVRASLQQQPFWSTLGVLLVPLLLIGAVSVLLYRVGIPGRKPTPAHAPEDEPRAPA
jgi:hypothetical protein